MLWARTVLTVFFHNKIRACGLTGTYEDNRVQYFKTRTVLESPQLAIARLPWDLENMMPRVRRKEKSSFPCTPGLAFWFEERSPGLPEPSGTPETSNTLEDVQLLNTLVDLWEDWILSGQRRRGGKGTGRPPRYFIILLTAAWAPSFLLTLPGSSHPSPCPLPYPCCALSQLPLTTWLWAKVTAVIEGWRGIGLRWTCTLGSFLHGPIHVEVWYNSFLVIWGLRFWGSSFLQCSPGPWGLSRTTVLWKGLRTPSSNLLCLAMPPLPTLVASTAHIHTSGGCVANVNGISMPLWAPPKGGWFQQIFKSLLWAPRKTRPLRVLSEHFLPQILRREGKGDMGSPLKTSFNPYCY